jgi:riboflavin biosynthesis pyrimidine reductase
MQVPCNGDSKPAAFAELRQRRIAHISCIGGRTIATALLDAGLVDDV